MFFGHDNCCPAGMSPKLLAIFSTHRMRLLGCVASVWKIFVSKTLGMGILGGNSCRFLRGYGMYMEMLSPPAALILNAVCGCHAN